MNQYVEMKKVIMNLDDSTSIYLAGHENVDYDSICSTLAFTRYLNLLGKSAFMLLEEKDLDKLTWFGDYTYIKTSIDQTEETYDFIQMDSNRKSRLGIFESNFDKAKTTINIDHHEENKKEADHLLSIGEISSTSEIIYNLVKLFSIDIDKKIAELLFAGIVSDTYCFLQRTTSETFQVVSNLLAYGIDNQSIIKSVYLNKSAEEVKVLADMLTHIKYDKFHYIIMNRRDELYKNVDYNVIFKKCIPTIQNIDHVDILGLYLIDGNTIFGEYRSNCDIEIDKLVIALGGGGHKKAGGFTTDKGVSEIIEITKEYIEKNGKEL